MLVAAAALGALAGEVAAALGDPGVDARRDVEERLADHRHVGARDVTQGLGLDGDVAPGEELEPLGGQALLDRALRRGALAVALGAVLAGQEAHRDAQAGRVGAGGARGQELRGQRQQEPRAVPGLLVGRDRAAVLDAAQAVQPRVEDRAAGGAGGVGDEPDAARVVLEARVVEPGH